MARKGWRRAFREPGLTVSTVPTYSRSARAHDVDILASIQPDESTHVVVMVKLCQGFSYWQCPQSATLRDLASKVAKDAGRSLQGKRHEVSVSAAQGWVFHYPLS